IDIYMMSSVFEGLPIALLEAMSMKKAVISTDAGGIKEVIRPNMDGFICGVDEPERLVDFACNLINSPVTLQEYGDRARARVIENFSLKQMVARLEHLYLKYISG